jgi:hypothetical protein
MAVAHGPERMGRPYAGSNFPFHAAEAAELTGQHLEAGPMIRSNFVRNLTILFGAGVLCSIGTSLPACSDAGEPQYGEVVAEQGAAGAGGGYAVPGRGALAVGGAAGGQVDAGSDADSAAGMGGAAGAGGNPIPPPLPNIDPWKLFAPSVATRAFYQAGPPVVRWQHSYTAANSASGNAYVKQTIPTVGSWVQLPKLVSGTRSGLTLSMVGFGSTDPTYRLCAFIVGGDSKIYVSYAPQLNSNAGTWSSWTALPTVGLPGGIVTSAVSASVLESSQSLQMWARGTDGFPYQILARTDPVTKGYMFYGQWQRATQNNGNPYTREQQLATAPASVYKGQQGYYVFGLNYLGHPIAWIASENGYHFSELTTAWSNAAPSADLRYYGGNNTPVLDVWTRRASDNALVLYRPDVYACGTTPSCVDWKGEVSVGVAVTSAPSSAVFWECAEVDALGPETPARYGFARICGPTNASPWNPRDPRPTP